MSDSFRDLKAEARTVLHGRFEVSAKCFRGGINGTITDVELRVHTNQIVTGDLPETGYPFAERVEQDPRLVFLVEQHSPLQGDVYSISEIEAYEVQTVEIPEGVTVTVGCKQLTRKEAGTWRLALP